MYNKHKDQTTVYQSIIDNKVCVSFNTDQKRQAFIEKVVSEGRRRITCITNVIYPGRYNVLFIKIN